jgi:hypothetical protein
MLLIIGSEFEKAITNTCKWLNNMGVAYHRISLAELMYSELRFDITGRQFTFVNKGITVSSEDIRAVWIRKAGMNIPEFVAQAETAGFDQTDVTKFLGEEIITLCNYFFTTIESAYPRLGSFFTTRVNKLLMLQKAQSLGIRVPQTIVATAAAHIPWHTHSFITKPLSEIFLTRTGGYHYASYTSPVLQRDAGEELFFPSLLQQKIERRYDIRLFVLGGAFFSVAIAPGKDDNSSDWRDADKKQASYIPYHTPPELNRQLLQLMQAYNMNCAAIDLMEDMNGDIYFLEINPDGSYAVIEETLFIDFEQLIAQYLQKLML